MKEVSDSWFFEAQPAIQSDIELDAERYVGKLKSQHKRKQRLYQSVSEEMIVPQHVQPYKWPLFYGEILIGEGQSKVEVIFDTASDWLVVPSDTCNRCIGGQYNTTNDKR